MSETEAKDAFRVRTPLGMYDLNNMTGKMKARLLQSGAIALNPTPNNTPSQEKIPVAEKVPDINPYKVGDVVIWKKYASEIISVHPKKGLIIRLKEGRKSKWIHWSKVKEATVRKED